MGKDICGARISRLGKLMQLLRSRTFCSTSQLLEVGEYEKYGTICRKNARRSLQRDIAMLRDEFYAEIEYDAEKTVYVLKNVDQFPFYDYFCEEEMLSLVAGLMLIRNQVATLEDHAKHALAQLIKKIPGKIISDAEKIALSKAA